MSNTELLPAIPLEKSMIPIDGIYRLQSKIGFGSFGEVYLARDILSGKDVVVKLEPVHAKQHTIGHEFHVYKKLGGRSGIPRVHWFGTESGFNAMVMDRLGLSLDDLFVRCHHQFSVTTVLLLTRQLISNLKYIHSRNFIHRDLKPSNLVMGVGEHAHIVHLIDFGLSKEFRSPKTHLHIPYRDGLGLTGTVMFASIHSHLGLELGRRDDLESLAYILIYFLRGSLPWQGYKNKRAMKYKQKTSAQDLCRGFPVEFCTFLTYSRSLPYDQKPDYDYLSHLFDESLLQERSNDSDLRFDWDDQTNINENVVHE